MAAPANGITKFFVLSESVRTDSSKETRRIAANDAGRLKRTLRNAGLNVEEKGYDIRTNGLRGGYAPREISAYGSQKAFEVNATVISRSLGTYYHERGLVASAALS